VAIAFGLSEMWPSTLYKRQSLLLSSVTIVLKATLSIISHTDNNATLKPARRSPIEAGTCPSIWRGTPRSRFLPLDRPRPGGVGARPAGSLAPDRGRGQAGGLTSKRPRQVALELACRAPQAVGPVGDGVGLPRSGCSCRPEGSRSTPDHAGGKTLARVQGGHSAIGRACGAGGCRNPSAAF
jgi:hypothetical protein